MTTPPQPSPPNSRPGVRASDHDIWLFDLDNCLYPAQMGFFAQVDERIGAYVRAVTGLDNADAVALQKRYFHQHGTTLAGLMANHDIDPDHYLDYVHDVDMGGLGPQPGLADAIAALPGRRCIFTNADAPYARRVIERRGLAGLFDAIIDIKATGYQPKPHAAAYAHLAGAIPGFDPKRALFVDDMTRNLRPAHAMGITTIWLDNGSEAGDRDHDPAHVDHHITDLYDWLCGVTEQPKHP